MNLNVVDAYIAVAAIRIPLDGPDRQYLKVFKVYRPYIIWL